MQFGAGSRLVGDHIGSYHNDDLVLVGSELPHTWQSDEYRGKKYDRHKAIVLQFHPDFLGADFFHAKEFAAISDLLQHAQRGLWFPADVAQRVGQRMTSMLDMTGARRLIELLTCLDELAENHNAVPLASGSYSNQNTEDGATRIQVVCDHITQNLADHDLCHLRLAKLAHMNPSAFSRFFKQSTGRTVSGYVTELRIGLACRLLADTEAAVLDISYQSGFTNLSNFNRRFRQLRKITPRDYRQRYRDVGQS